MPGRTRLSRRKPKASERWRIWTRTAGPWRAREPARRWGSALFLASTSAPCDDRQNSGIVAHALRCTEQARTMDIAASQRAGTSGLMAALDAAAARCGAVLFVAAEKRRTPAGSAQELASG